MKIAIIGASRNWQHFNFDVEQLRRFGTGLAEAGHVVLTGSSPGLPHYVAQGAYRAGGRVLGFSPASSPTEHRRKWRSPIADYSKIYFCRHGLIYRQWEMLRRADAVVVLDGNIGTFSEVIIAYKEKCPLIFAREGAKVWPLWKSTLRNLEQYVAPDYCRVPLSAIVQRLLLLKPKIRQ